MGSSTPGRHKITAFLVAGKNPEKTANAKPHEELANAQDGVAAEWFFYDRWGPLSESDALEEKALEEGITREEKLERIRAKGLPPPFLYQDLRDALREAWRAADQYGQSRLIPAQGLHSDQSPFNYIEDVVGRYMKYAWRFENGRIEIAPESLWGAICILFMRDCAAGRTAICANPNCHSPYFIKKRDTQIYCGNGECMLYGHNKSANDYWNRVGKTERTKKLKRTKKQKKAGKRKG